MAQLLLAINKAHLSVWDSMFIIMPFNSTS